MGARHVEELFSAAYDDALSPAERRRYDEHLAGCAPCAAAADEFRQAVEAVRALPAARMPVRVVLPATPPVAAPVEGRWRRVLRPPQLSPAWSAGVLALAGVVAVVLLARGVGLHGTGGTSSSAIAHAPALQFGVAGGAGAHGPAASTTEKRAGLGTDSCPLPIQETTTTPGVTAGGGPAGFANRVTVRVPQRPGQELVLATTGSRYAAGSQVLVFAALTTTSSGGRAVVPCVTLEPQQTVALIPTPDQGQGLADGVTGGGTTGSTGSSGSNVSGGGQGLAPSSAVPVPESAPQAVSPLLRSLLTPDQVESFAPYVLERPLAIASPTTQTVGGTLPVQVLTIPGNLPHGTVLRLVALVPAGTPGSGDRPAVEAVLTLEIS